MHCPRCAAKNPEHFNFCNRCGLSFAAENLPPPFMREPSDPPIIHKPYKAAYIIGIIGSFISALLFSATIFFDVYIENFNIITSSFILHLLQVFLFVICGVIGYTGSYLLIKEKHIGIILLFTAALLPTVLYFIYLPLGFVSLLSTPLLLAGGITALIRKNQLVKYYNQPYTR